MKEYYSVTVCGKPAGTVKVLRKGLYYYFSCRCCLPGDIIYRLVVSCGTLQENLGILIPKDCGFGIDTKLSVKLINYKFLFTSIS